MNPTIADVRKLMDDLNGAPYVFTLTQDRHIQLNPDIAKTLTTLPDHFARVHTTLAEDLGFELAEVPRRLALQQCNVSVPQTGGVGRKELVDADDLLKLGNPLYRQYLKHKNEEPDPTGWDWWTANNEAWMEREFVKGL